MILTNLHMVDIPYARKVSCARESKVIEVTHTLLHLSLAHMDELDSRACICASFCKVLCSPHNCLPAHHSGHHSSLRSPYLASLSAPDIGVLAFSAVSDQLILIQQQHFSS